MDVCGLSENGLGGAMWLVVIIGRSVKWLGALPGWASNCPAVRVPESRTSSQPMLGTGLEHKTVSVVLEPGIWGAAVSAGQPRLY